jgi:Ca2+-binding RTX toxin-like protein
VRRGILIRAAVAVSALFLLAAPAAQAKPGDVIVGEDGGSQTVTRIHPNGTPTGAQSVLASGSPLHSTGGGDFGTDGTFYESDYGLPGIVKINPKTHHASTLSTNPLFVSLSDVEFHPNGKLYASDFHNDAIYRINRKTGAASIFTSGGKISGDTYGLAVGPSGAIFVADNSGRVVKVDPKTRHQTLVSDDPDLSDLWGIAVSVTGKIFVVDRNVPAVLRIDPSGPPGSNATAITTPTNVLAGPYDLAFTLPGQLVTANLSDASVARINPHNGDNSILFSGGLLTKPEGITVEPPRCGGKVATIYGTPKRDKIKGSPFNDVIAGLGANDVIKGDGGRDFICGNSGNDKLIGGAKRDRLIGGPGHDITRQ